LIYAILFVGKATYRGQEHRADTSSSQARTFERVRALIVGYAMILGQFPKDLEQLNVQMAGFRRVNSKPY
jgi:hypothetical protein